MKDYNIEIKVCLINIIIENYLSGLIKTGKRIPLKRFLRLAEKQTGFKADGVSSQLFYISNGRYYLTNDIDFINKVAVFYFSSLVLSCCESFLSDVLKSENVLSLQKVFFENAFDMFLSLPDKLIADSKRKDIVGEDISNDLKNLAVPNFTQAQEKAAYQRFYKYLKTETIRKVNVERLFEDILKGEVTVKTDITCYLANRLGYCDDYTYFYDDYENFIKKEGKKYFVTADLTTNTHLLCLNFLTSVADKFIDKKAKIFFVFKLGDY